MRRVALPLAVFLLLSAQVPRSLYQEGIRAATNGDLRKADASLSRAARQQPQESPGYYVHYWLGVVREKLGDKEGALKEWRESVRQRFSVDHTDIVQRMHALEQGHALRTMPRPERPPVTSLPPKPMPMPPPPTATIANTTMPTTTTMATTSTTTAATTTVATNPDVSLFDEIDRRFAELSPGEVVFTAPEKMRVADTSEVSLRIAAKNHAAGILEGLTEGVTATAEQEHITPVMEARLDGGAGVEVEALGKDAQSVAGGGFAEWRWNVTPKKSGSQRLTVSIIAHLTYPDGHDVPKTVRTLTRKVEVSANAGDSIKTFLASYWQWLTTTLIIPIVLFLYRRRANGDKKATT